MFKIYDTMYWVSGLAFGLSIGAFIACPYWKIAVPVMLFISLFCGRTAFVNKKNEKNENR